MKLSEIALRIDKSKENENWVDVEEIGNLFDLQIWNCCDKNTRLKSYWVGNWCCTDTWVGYRMYFLDDEPVAFSIQSGRKSSEKVMWFSKGLANKVKEYLISLTDYENNCQLEYCDFNEDIDDGYVIQFNGNVLDWSYATLNGQSVKFIERIKETPNYGIDTKVKVLYNEEEVIVDVSDLRFKYRLTD